MKIDGTTRVYGIIGNPVEHSLSPVMHNRAYQECGLNCVYLPFATTHVEKALDGIRHLNIHGVSVTIPHKEAVLQFLDGVDEVARKIGSVNTIKCLRDGKNIRLEGFNTDWLGANKALEQELHLKDSKVVILGAGGSARAIGFGLQYAGANIVLCSRTESRGRALADELDCEWISIDDSSAISGDALVNATSVGMVPDTEKIPVASPVLAEFPVVMDIVYAPLKTLLIKEAENRGCRCINGIEMLLYQGAAQFEIWLERKAPLEAMRDSLVSMVRKVYN